MARGDAYPLATMALIAGLGAGRGEAEPYAVEGDVPVYDKVADFEFYINIMSYNNK